MKRRWTWLVFGLWIASHTCLLGCTRRYEECDRLSLEITKGQGLLQRGFSHDPAGLKRMAVVSDEVAKGIEGTALTDDKLVGFRNDFAKMARDTANAIRNVATAMEADDAEKQAAAMKTLDGLEPRETKLIDGLNDYCGRN